MDKENHLKVLIIAAHGSRKAASNAEVEKLALRLKEKLTGQFDDVTHAFLQFAEPMLEPTLEKLAGRNISQITVFPFFIGAGSHITEDIPQLIDKIKDQNPDIQISLTRHLGAINSIDDVIIQEVS